MPKWEASRSKNKHFALYWLQFQRFRWIIKFGKKCNVKGHPKSFKIGAAGAFGVDFPCYIFWDFPILVGQLGPNRDPAGIYWGSTGDHRGSTRDFGQVARCQLRARTRGTSGNDIEYSVIYIQ